MVDPAAPSGLNWTNETGTLLDIGAAPDGSNRGFVTCASQHQTLGQRHSMSIGRYQLSADGASIRTTRELDGVSGFSVRDPDAKTRLLALSETQFVTVTASSSVEIGLTVKHRQQGTGSSDFSVLADVGMDAMGLSSMPSPAALAVSSAWDAVYDPARHLVWIYYIDTTGRRLMKTHVSLHTGLAAGDEVEVAADIGPANAVHHAIRVHRGSTIGQQVLITIAARTGTDHDLFYVLEEVNLAPDIPDRRSAPNFDATGPATLQWVFRDPNPSDIQSAYQVQVWNDLTDTLTYDSGKTPSFAEAHTLPGDTLTNGGRWRWRVRTWDRLDAESPWSSAGRFETSASGNVSVTWPPVDNTPTPTADLQVQWAITGAVQDHYRVRVVRTTTGTVHSDTGWIESTATGHLVQGLTSEVEHRIEVTARSNGIESSTGSRLVTPDYSRPIEPVVAVVPVDDAAHIRVEVDHPPPGMDLGGPDGNFEAGSIAGWVTDPAVEVVGTSGALAFSTTTTVAVPAGTRDGDLLLWWTAANYDEQLLTTPAGWTEQQYVPFGETGTDRHGLWLHSSIASSEPASYDLLWGGTQWHSSSGVAVRNIAGFNGWAFTSIDTGEEVVFPSVPVQVGDVVLYLGYTAQSGTRTITPTVVVDVDNDRGVWVGHIRSEQAGDTPPRTFRLTGPQHAMAAAVLLLTPLARFTATDAHAHAGQFSARLLVSGTPPRAGVRPAQGRRVEVIPHHRYTVSYWARTEADLSGVTATLDWYSADGQLLSSSSAAPITLPTGEWVLIQHSASRPPARRGRGMGPTCTPRRTEPRCSWTTSNCAPRATSRRPSPRRSGGPAPGPQSPSSWPRSLPATPIATTSRARAAPTRTPLARSPPTVRAPILLPCRGASGSLGCGSTTPRTPKPRSATTCTGAPNAPTPSTSSTPRTTTWAAPTR
ncbi:hypothetical protein BJF83_20895 [Nocardiopsis sp. CNR-923]|uniref:glycoside hydrolase family 78 protein n=1 Tax=Nocardiopsis sp. CNR-923 TaxID=1904965 RepID=UPI000964284D|nr:hypothetical protein [Nocardiopsis sp. CNR-923]OLT26545.1 hypothetical protein BJF83_20895 [Nocardiopsis sp. CNR-923]